MKHCLAFTLIEVLASTALAVLLMVAVLGVSQSTAGHRRAMAEVVHTPLWVDRAFDLIAWDLQHARSYAIEPDRLTLAGYGSLDTDTNRPTYRPVLIEYRLVNNNLIRTQTDLNAITTSSTRKSLVGRGIGSFKTIMSSTDNAVSVVQIKRETSSTGETEPQEDQTDQIPHLPAAPDPMDMSPGLNPLNPTATLTTSLTLEEDEPPASYSRAYLVGAGP